MALDRFEKDMAVIQALPDEPNDVGGLSAQELKAKFDEGGQALKEYINDRLIPALEEVGVEQILQSADMDNLRYIRLGADNTIEVSADGQHYITVASSGHIIYNGAVQMPQRSRLRFENTEVTDDGNYTVIRGIKGDTGPAGPVGPQGERGATGPKGDIGSAWYPAVDGLGNITFTLTDTATPPPRYNIRGPQGPQGVQGAQGPVGPAGVQGVQGVPGVQGVQGRQGERGPEGPAGPAGPVGAQGERGNDGADGRSFVIKDVYATLGELKAAFPLGNEFAYQVTEEDDEIFIWSESNGTWASLGKLQGPAGPAGAPGATGPAGPTGPEGPQGIQGVRGEQGPAGPQGAQGIQGVQGIAGVSAYTAASNAGYMGTETQFNTDLAQVGNKAGKLHASQHAEGGEDPITLASIGAEAAGAATSAVGSHNTNDEAHADIRTLINGKADATHDQSASTISAGTFKGLVKALNLSADMNGVRNITASTTDLTAGTSTLATGNIYFVYE